MREAISRTVLHRILIAIGAFLLFWPSITTNLFGDGLSGYDPRSEAPPFELSAWLDGRFQEAADQWWKERFGLRFFFVKTNNQINYALWDRVYEGGQAVVFGKGGWLYERGYIATYCRLEDPVPTKRLRTFFEQLALFQQAMDERGVPFVVLLTPSKAAIYPERIPDEFCGPQPTPGREYDQALSMMAELGIRYVDGYQLTQDAKSLWPDITLFTKGGTHWNNLGAYYSAASLIELAGELSGRTLPPLVLDDVVVDNHPTGPDVDLVNYLNLLFPDTDFPTAHPSISMKTPADGPLRAVFIGMSFLEEVLMDLAQTGAFEQLDHYWYYHHDIRDVLTGTKRPVTRETIDWPGEILAADLLVLDLNMRQVANLHAERFVEDGLAWLAANPRWRPLDPDRRASR
jgi:hypothetical protein